MEFFKNYLKEFNNETINQLLNINTKNIISQNNFYSYSPDLLLLGFLIFIVAFILYFLNSSCWWVVLLIGIAILLMLNYSTTITFNI